MSEFIERFCERCGEVVKIHKQQALQSDMVLLECERPDKVSDPECKGKCVYEIINQLGYIEDTTNPSPVQLNPDKTIKVDKLVQDGLVDYTSDLPRED